MTTPREQLAKLLHDHGNYQEGHVDGVHCAGSTSCHWRGETIEEWENHRIDAIIAAGWTPPTHPEEEEEPFSRMSYEAMEAKLAQQESAPRIT